MNLAEFRTRVARTVGLSTSDSGDLDLIDAWVNEGVLQFLRDTKVNVITGSLTTTDGVNDYVLDDEILSFTDAWYEPSDGIQEVLLEPVDSREMQLMRRHEGTVETTPRYYALQGAHLFMLHPTPASDTDTVHLLYTPRPNIMSSTADSPSNSSTGNVPSEFHPIIEAYAKWKAAQAEEHRPSEYGLQFQAEYERGVSMTRAHLNRKGGVFKGRKRAGRRTVWPITPGTDIRS